MKLEKQEIVRFDVPNKNNRIYPSSIMNTLSKSYYGHLGMTTENCHISHKVSNFQCEYNILYADIETLNTPDGLALKGILECTERYNINCGFRTSGTGTLQTDGTVTKFNLQAINFVLDPA